MNSFVIGVAVVVIPMGIAFGFYIGKSLAKYVSKTFFRGY
jgi:hypothetical protein